MSIPLFKNPLLQAIVNVGTLSKTRWQVVNWLKCRVSDVINSILLDVLLHNLLMCSGFFLLFLMHHTSEYLVFWKKNIICYFMLCCYVVLCCVISIHQESQIDQELSQSSVFNDLKYRKWCSSWVKTSEFSLLFTCNPNYFLFFFFLRSCSKIS